MTNRGRIGKISVLLLVSALSVSAQTKPWITAYFGGWNIYTQLPSTIDFGGMTVLDHMSILPSSSGSFINAPQYMAQNYSTALITAAHAAGVKVTVTMGAWNTASAFQTATSPVNLPTFVANLAAFVISRGYDGVDIDWEPFSRSDTTQFQALIIALRTALPSPYLITVTCAWGYPYSAFASVQNYIDQINLMTYDFDTDAPGYNSWYAAPVYSNGVTIPANNLPAPSCDWLVGQMEAAGIQAGKIGIGCEPGGCLWQGVTGVGQPYSSSTKWTEDVSYNTIMSGYYADSLYHYDSGAGATYLSSQSGGWFLSYDDTTALKAKLNYINTAGIGGLIIYEIGMSYSNGSNPFLEVTRKFLGNAPSVTDTVPPAVSISSPSGNSTISGTVTVTATATDNVGVASVTFAIDNSVVSTRTSSPYSFPWNTTNYTNGSHTIRVTAYDASGNSHSATETVTVSNSIADTTPPNVSFSTPGNNTVVSGIVPVNASASDDVSVSSVTFYIDGSTVRSFTSPPYSYFWNTSNYSNGSHTVEATAFDPSGNSSSATIGVTVHNLTATPPDTVPPKVSIESPSNDTTVAGKVTVSVYATDSVGIKSVTISVNGKFVTAISNPPFSIIWNTDSVADGNYNIVVTAYDSSGNSSTDSVRVYVGNHIPPTISIFSPSQGATIKGTFWIKANISSILGISSVNFKLDSAEVANLTKPPFVASWDSKEVTDGAHTVFVTATDSSGNQSIDSVSVNVDNGTAGITHVPGSPTNFGLLQNYPNPFNPSTLIQYQLPVESLVQLKVYDMLGREVATLVNGAQSPGYYTVTFDASRLNSGTYLYRIVAISVGKGRDFSQTKKLLVLK